MKNIQRKKIPKVVVITGGSAGIGRATARRFAKEGARTGLLARGSEGLEGARRDVETLDGEALPIPTDVSSPEQIEAAASMIEQRLGPIDIWINNAMTSVFSPVKETPPEEYRRVTEVTYLGCVYGTLSALKRMLPRDHGTIVQVGSALAFRGNRFQPTVLADHSYTKSGCSWSGGTGFDCFGSLSAKISRLNGKEIECESSHTQSADHNLPDRRVSVCTSRLFRSAVESQAAKRSRRADCNTLVGDVRVGGDHLGWSHSKISS